MVSALFTLGTGCAPVTASYASRSLRADSTVRAAIAREQTLRATELPENTVGVLPLTVRSTDSTYAALGYGLSALLATDLAQSKSLRVVERLRLDAVLRELDLAKTGRVDPATAPRAGRLVGARRLIVGDVAVTSGGALEIGSRIANSVSGRVDGRQAAKSALTNIFDAEKALVLRIFESLGVTLSPAERRDLERRPTESVSAFLAFSRGVRLEANQDFAGAAASFQQALSLDPNFREARLRAATLSGVPQPALADRLMRVSALSTGLVNPPAPVIIGTGVDVPSRSREVVRILITVRTP